MEQFDSNADMGALPAGYPLMPEIPLQDFSAFFETTGVQVFVKRFDLMDPVWGGNKWFKLLEHVRALQEQPGTPLLTFGGAYSNHIAATAAVCAQLKIPCIGVIRGDGLDPQNPTLSRAQSQGMQLEFVSRTAYRSKNQPWFLDALRKKFGDFYMVPEGGADVLGVLGAMRMFTSDLMAMDHLVVACGTGTTLSGLAAAAQAHQKTWGLPVFKDGGFLTGSVENLLQAAGKQAQAKWILRTEYGFGGYAKTPPEIWDFIDRWEPRGLPLDPIYTAKAFRGLQQMVFEGAFEQGSKVAFLHTGGLQGVNR